MSGIISFKPTTVAYTSRKYSCFKLFRRQRSGYSTANQTNIQCRLYL